MRSLAVPVLLGKSVDRLASMVFLVLRSIVGLRRHPDRQTLMEAVVVGFLLFTVAYSALR